METKALKGAVKTSTSDVLETMFFLPIEFSDAEEERDLSDFLKEKNLLAARIPFSGPFAGTFSLVIPPKMARSLTGSFLGEEEEDVGDPEITGTVKEILNMITGKSFSVFDAESVFELALPEMIGPQEALREDPEGASEKFTLLIRTLDATFALRLLIRS